MTTNRDDLVEQVRKHHEASRDLVKEEFLKYITVEDKRILEVGSDTVLGTASLLIESGAKEVVCTNPFEKPLVSIENPNIKFFSSVPTFDWVATVSG